MPVVNTTNEHMSNFTSKVGAVDGYIGGSNPNIQRGGGYGFNGKGMPGFGPMPIKSYSNCGTLKTPNLGVGKQYAGSPPPQRGGSSSAGCAGVPYASFVKPVTGLNNYAPVTQNVILNAEAKNAAVAGAPNTAVVSAAKKIAVGNAVDTTNMDQVYPIPLVMLLQQEVIGKRQTRPLIPALMLTGLVVA